ncbi:MAG: ferritin-like domain-containing protein [Anaerolineae bacterium]|nr:ferritin-like domain-containing protein [Gemmatimonadaceae bacterium]
MENRNILDTVDSDLAERLLSRRAALGSTLTATFALASVPLGLAALARRAFAQGPLPAQIINVLNFALTLEYLESEFYETGVATSGLIPVGEADVFDQIRKHESAHVAFLLSVLGASAVSKPTFDFTAGNGSGTGPYADVFSNYETFKAVSQAFEDTGVRAYKGQAANLMSNDAILRAALQIHSVEARHASEVRRLRGLDGWITQAFNNIPGADAVYADEDAVRQFGISVPGITPVPRDEITEAFDEPLSMGKVLAIVAPFIVGSNP